MKILDLWKSFLVLTILGLLSFPLYSQQTVKIKDISFHSDFDPNPGQTLRTNSLKSNPDDRLNGVMTEISFLPDSVSEDSDGVAVSTIISDSELQDVTEKKLLSEALFYPNPFRQDEGAELGYKLSADMDIEILIYDMRGNLIHKDFAQAGTIGAQQGYQRVATKSSKGTVGLGLDQLPRLPSAVYFYILRHEGQILTKNKFVVIP